MIVWIGAATAGTDGAAKRRKRWDQDYDYENENDITSSSEESSSESNANTNTDDDDFEMRDNAYGGNDDDSSSSISSQPSSTLQGNAATGTIQRNGDVFLSHILFLFAHFILL